jgi:hypothetical protein
MGSDRYGVDAQELARGQWTPIAFRPRLVSRFINLHWIPIDGAPIDAETAHRLRQAGAIFIANRHTREFVELVVRPAASLEEARPVGQPRRDEVGPSP